MYNHRYVLGIVFLLSDITDSVRSTCYFPQKSLVCPVQRMDMITPLAIVLTVELLYSHLSSKTLLHNISRMQVPGT